MAIVTDPRWRALDAQGNAYVGGSLTLYKAGTTTPADIYRDAGRTVPMTNPTTGADRSDANGWFPQVFAEQDQTFDVVVKKADGTTLWSLVNVPSLGAEAGVLSRDFGASGRLRIAGSAGVVRVEGGNPTGDDVGGQLTIGGYDGTQADEIILDGESVNATGNITEKGKRLPGVVYTTGTVSAASTGDIVLPNSPAGVRAWDIDLIDIFLSAATPGLSATFSYDGGATYVSSATYGYAGIDHAGSTQTPFFAAPANSIVLANSIASTGSSSPGWKLAGRIRVVTSSSYPTLLESAIARPGIGTTRHFSSGACSDTLARATNLRLTPSSGTISFIYRVIPLRGFGEP